MPALTAGCSTPPPSSASGLQHCHRHAFDEGRRIGMRGRWRHDHRKLIAAQARHQVTHAHLRLQAPRHLDQQRIALGVAVDVVHLLEAVAVDEQQCHGLIGFTRLRHGRLQMLLEAGAVGQAGQAVVQRKLLQLGILLPQQRLAMLQLIEQSVEVVAQRAQLGQLSRRRHAGR